MLEIIKEKSKPDFLSSNFNSSTSKVTKAKAILRAATWYFLSKVLIFIVSNSIVKLLQIVGHSILYFVS